MMIRGLEIDCPGDPSFPISQWQLVTLELKATYLDQCFLDICYSLNFFYYSLFRISEPVMSCGVGSLSNSSTST